MPFLTYERLNFLKEKIQTDISSLGKNYRARKSDFLKISVNHNLVDGLVSEGWDIDEILKSKTRLIKEKKFHQKFEDEIWCQMYELGFRILNVDENLELPFGKQDFEKKQIDVLAIWDNIALIIECKSSEKVDIAKPFKEEFELLNLRLDGYKKSLDQLYGTDMKVKYVLATKNLRINIDGEDMKRFKSTNSYLHAEKSFSYVNNLIKTYKGIAHYQFFGLLFGGQLFGKDRLQIPAIKGDMGGLDYYMFSIEPGTLLNMSYVLHRTGANSAEMPTYQRLLNPNRLNGITKFIDGEDGEGGGFFPNSLIINFNSKKHKLEFSVSDKTSDSSSRLGILKIPKAFRIAYVIDGQHRLYGYAKSKFKNTNTIPVVAFDNLPSETQLKIFDDINTNQKAISKSLRITLERDLFWSDKRASKRINALASAIAIDMGENPKSPLYLKVTVGEDKSLIKLDSISNTIKKSNLLPITRSNSFSNEGNQYCLYDTLNQEFDLEMKKSLARVTKLLSLCYDFGNKNYYDLYSKEKEFILSDRGVIAYISLIGSLNKFLIDKSLVNQFDKIEKLYDLLLPYLDCLYDELTKVDDDLKDEILRAYGEPGNTRWIVFFMSLVNKSFKEFSPVELIEWNEKRDKVLQAEGEEYGNSIEGILKNKILSSLEMIYGKNWHYQISEIKNKLMSEAQKDIDDAFNNLGEEIEVHWTEKFNITDYHTIVKKFWSKEPEEPNDDFVRFDKMFSIDIGLGNFNSKVDQTRWLFKYKTLRNNYSHKKTKNKGLTKKDVATLKKLYDKLKIYEKTL